MNRRDFLKAACVAPIAATGCTKNDEVPQAGAAGPWGAPPPSAEGLVLPESLRPDGTLEIFCLGGLSPWETFYTVPTHGKSGKYEGQQLWTFMGTGAIQEWVQRCAPDLPDPLWVPFAEDSVGQLVHLGPFAYTLRDRPDMLARMRVWVVNHHLEPHELAIPLAVTGHSVGNPRQAALGSHLQRYVLDREPGRQLPPSYAVHMGSFDPTNNAPAFTASGLHPSWARPLSIQLGSGTRLQSQLQRPATRAFAGRVDDLTAHYTAQLRTLLTATGRPDAIRSHAFNEFSVSRSALRRAEALSKLLPADLLTPQIITACVQPVVQPGLDVPDETTSGLQLARHLLTNSQEKARYVQLLDGGLITDRVGQGYDSHGEHVAQQATNVAHMLRGLSDIVKRPGEVAPDKLDLDKHFVLLNTEFGRAQFPEFSPRNPEGGGTNHWPWGYVVVGFGKFIDKQRSGVVGAISESSYASQGFSPAEHRAAMLLAHGVWPFTTESYAVGDVGGVDTEEAAARRLMREVLGYEA